MASTDRRAGAAVPPSKTGSALSADSSGRWSRRTRILPGPAPFVFFRLCGCGGTDSPGGGADGGSEPVVLSCAYGPHYSPTLHYPKVVALLKVLFPLPDVIVYRPQVRYRFVSPQGIARPSWNLNAGADAPGGIGCEIVLTVEEIKDVLSSTGLSSSYAGALTSSERSVGRAMSGAGTRREKCPPHVPGHGH